MMKAVSALLMTGLMFFGSASALTTPEVPAAAACSTSSFRPDQFEVAIDRTTGIAFVHTPCGWSLMGVIKPEAIEEGIALSQAKPVPAAVLSAEVTLQPWLAAYRSRLASR